MNNDLISREAAIAICSGQYKDCLRKSDWCGDTVAWNIGFQIKQLPAVDAVEVKHGRWIWDADNDRYICSNCNNEPLGDCYGGCVSHLSDYCPNCGTKMDGDG